MAGASPARGARAPAPRVPAARGRRLYRVFAAVHRVDEWLERRFSGLGRMVLGALGLGIVLGINTRAALAYQLACVAAGLLACALGCAPWLRPRVEVSRRLPRHGTAGEPLRYVVRAVNRGRRRLAGLAVLERPECDPAVLESRLATPAGAERRRNWFDRRVGYPRWIAAVREARGARATPAPLAPIGAGAAVETVVSLVPLRRGHLRLGRLSVLRTEPLGIFCAERRAGGPARVLVLPRTHPVRWRGGGAGGGADVASGRVDAQRTGGGEELASVREYRPGDPLRHLHWRGWARYGFPVVKEFHDTVRARRAVVLDVDLPGGAPPERFEAAVEVAASLVRAAGPGGASLVLGGPAPLWLDDSRPGLGTVAALEALAVVRPRADAGALAALGRALVPGRARLAACAFVLLDWDEDRRRLVGALAAAGVPVAPIVIADAPEPALSVRPETPPGGATLAVRTVSAARLPEALAALR